MNANAQQIHGSAVAVDGRAALLVGKSGAGKTSLAFEMLALGADLVADDQVLVTQEADGLMLAPPPHTAGLIEARGVGLIRMPVTAKANLSVLVDMDQLGTDRLPPLRERHLLGRAVPVIFGKGCKGLAAILMVLLRHGTLLDPLEIGPA